MSGRALALALGLAGTPLAATPAAAADGVADGLRREAEALAALDDEAGMARAAALLDEAERIEPGAWQVGADRAMLEALEAAARRDEGVRLGDAALLLGGRELRERALDRLRPLARAHPDDPSVLRALAVHAGLDGIRAEAERLAARARVAGAAGPWIDFAEAMARAGAAGRAGSVPILTSLVAAHPGMGRPRLALAGTLLELGRAEEALAALDGLLAASPDHARAKRLKAAILAPPPGQVVFQPAPDDAPPPRPAGLLPRKPRSGG